MGGLLPSVRPTGRPKGVREQDVYICDYRLDKSAHLFYKIHRNRYPVCTRPYAFDHFPKRLTPRRDFSVSARPAPPRRGSPGAPHRFALCGVSEPHEHIYSAKSGMSCVSGNFPFPDATSVRFSSFFLSHLFVFCP